jgi:hypothetical protein
MENKIVPVELRVSGGQSFGSLPPIPTETPKESTKQLPTVRKRTDKVAIVGFAPSSMMLAPFQDESWEIWTLNNIYTALPANRWDRWFEMHKNFREYPPMHDVRMDAGAIVRGDSRPAGGSKIEHIDWLKGQSPERPIYFLNDEPDIPAAVKYPLEEIKAWCEKEGLAPYFSNSISYMIALALMDGYKTIGVWGVDMAAGGEYQQERPSVEYWLGVAKKYANVVLPKETELLKARLYGYESDSEFVTKAKVRYGELMSNHNRAVEQAKQAMDAANYFRGAAEDCQYFITNWGNGA